MMATTIISSISVKPHWGPLRFWIFIMIPSSSANW